MDIIESINRYLVGSPASKGERTRLIRARDEIVRLRTASQETINGRTVQIDWKAQALDLRELVRLGGIKIAELESALAEQAQQQECKHCGGIGDVSGEYPGVACPECSGSGVQIKPEFFTHSVEQPYDWSDWVCPDPKSYLMKCCDCGLVHEAQFGVVRYKSETEREGCDMVDDPNLQAVFRMRRSEQWSPEDIAHRAGGLPMEQPAQQQNGPINEGWQITVAHGHSGYGVYAHMEDYPEEGAVLVQAIKQP